MNGSNCLEKCKYCSAQCFKLFTHDGEHLCLYHRFIAPIEKKALKTMKESKTTKFSKFPETIYPPYSQKPWCNPYKSAEWKEKVTKQLQKRLKLLKFAESQSHDKHSPRLKNHIRDLEKLLEALK